MTHEFNLDDDIRIRVEGISATAGRRSTNYFEEDEPDELDWSKVTDVETGKEISFHDLTIEEQDKIDSELWEFVADEQDNEEMSRADHERDCRDER